MSDRVTDLQVFRGEPAANTVILQIDMESLCKILIAARVGDETGVVLNGAAVEEGGDVFDIVFREADAAEEISWQFI